MQYYLCINRDTDNYNYYNDNIDSSNIFMIIITVLKSNLYFYVKITKLNTAVENSSTNK